MKLLKPIREFKRSVIYLTYVKRPFHNGLKYIYSYASLFEYLLNKNLVVAG